MRAGNGDMEGTAQLRCQHDSLVWMAGRYCEGTAAVGNVQPFQVRPIVVLGWSGLVHTAPLLRRHGSDPSVPQFDWANADIIAAIQPANDSGISKNE